MPLFKNKIKLPLVFASITFFFFFAISSRSIFAQPTSTPLPTPFQGATHLGATVPASIGSITFTGYTSPNAFVVLNRDTAVISTMTACPSGPPTICTDPSTDGYFETTVTGMLAGIYTFGIYSVDTDSSLSTPTIVRTIPIFQGVPNTADLITLPPTISVDKIVMKRPERQTVRGVGRPNTDVRLFFNLVNPFADDTNIENDGTWEVTNPEVLSLGTNYVYAVIQGTSGQISQFSKIISFEVQQSADLNLDDEVDVLDFSILMFNYEDPTPDDWAADINDDGVVDLSDFSIMMFNWTGT